MTPKAGKSLYTEAPEGFTSSCVRSPRQVEPEPAPFVLPGNAARSPCWGLCRCGKLTGASLCTEVLTLGSQKVIVLGDPDKINSWGCPDFCLTGVPIRVQTYT